MDPKKLEVIIGWPIPNIIHELRRFIGMCTYYRCFIEKLYFIARSLHEITKKIVKFAWPKKKN